MKWFGAGREDRVALVTGANRGIGFEISRQLAKKGVRVIITARDRNKGEEACRTVTREGGDAVFYPLDVTHEREIHDVAQGLEKKMGRLDILVNNAGIMIDPEGNTLETNLETVKRTMETNCYGPFRMCQAFFPFLRKSPRGRIINISSGMGQLHEMGGYHAGYRLSKTALNALTAILANELASTSVRVNAMCPGWVRTDMGGSNAHRSVQKGAETAVWLATARWVPNGKFLRDRNVMDW